MQKKIRNQRQLQIVLDKCKKNKDLIKTLYYNFNVFLWNDFIATIIQKCLNQQTIKFQEFIDEVKYSKTNNFKFSQFNKIILKT